MSHYRFLSLFSGIGGFELAAQIANSEIGHEAFEPAALCEINPFSQKVLQHHFPGVPHIPDVRTITVELIREFGRIDGIVGGFPCQDISNAGKRAGLEGERSGLFYEIIRLVRLVRPRFVFLENVAAIVGRGLSDVLGAFAQVGFNVEWSVIPCSRLGGSHQRERIWIIAHPMQSASEVEEFRPSGQGWQHTDTSQSTVVREDNGKATAKRTGASFNPSTNTDCNRCNDRAALEREGLSSMDGQRNTPQSEPKRQGWECEPGAIGDTANSNSERLEVWQRQPTQQVAIAQSEQRDSIFNWQAAIESLVRSCHDGLPVGLANDSAYLLRLADLPDWMPYAADLLPIAYRKEALQALGNAIVPQVGAIGFLRIYALLQNMENP